jgi:TPR repeat protein
MCAGGRGLPGGLPDDARAVALWSRAAAAGDAEATQKLAYCYYNGRGGLAPDAAEGKRLYNISSGKIKRTNKAAAAIRVVGTL